MFDKKEYQAAFSKVRASEETYQEVMHMASRRKNRKSASGRRAVVLIAAVIALMAMTVTAFASEYVQSWFVSYFSRENGTELSDSQVQFVEENEQVIGESKTQSDWTVELRSVMSEGDVGYLIFGVTAPQGVNLTPEIVDNSVTESFGFNNNESSESSDFGILSCSEKMFTRDYYIGGTVGWKEDGDGLDNTKNVIIELNVVKFTLDAEVPDFFGSETEWNIHIDSIVHEYDNEEYRQDLLNGKYKGETDIMFTEEEVAQLTITEVLAEGPWDFTFRFTDSDGGIELLSEPVQTLANIWRKTGSSIEDYDHFLEEVTVTSIMLNSYGAVVTYKDCNGGPSFHYEDKVAYAVMKDGTMNELYDWGHGGVGYALLKSETPIVLEEVDHIRMADGTIIPMPELETE